MAFDTGVLNRNNLVPACHAEQIEIHKMVKEGVVNYAKDRSPFVNQPERDAYERKPVNKVGSAI